MMFRMFHSAAWFSMLLVGLTTVSKLPAQGWRQRDAVANELIEAPREMRTLLDQAKRAIDQKQWGEATAALGLILGIDVGVTKGDIKQDYFLEIEDPANPNNAQLFSLRDEARRMLSDFPDQGVEFIDLRFGVDAGRSLDEALATSSLQELEKVSRVFGFTSAGRKARWYLAQRALGRGEPLQAALLLEQLASEPGGKKLFGDSLHFDAAKCWKLVGQSERAISNLVRASESERSGRVPWSEQSLRDLSEPSKAAKTLSNLETSDVVQRSAKQSSWLSANGAPDGNPDTNAGLPLPFVRWHIELHESVQIEAALEELLREQSSQLTAQLPARMPIVVGSHVFFLTYDHRVFAINQRTGKLDWPISFSGLPVYLVADKSDPFFTRMQQADDLGYLRDRVWGNWATGQLSSDGERLYLVTELSVLEAAEKLALAPNRIRSQIESTPLNNVLRAYSIKEEGKTLWQVGGSDGLNEPKLSGALFLGPPVLVGSQLMAMVELTGEVHIVGLDPRTGRATFIQQLVANNLMPIATDESRRNLACLPAAEAGILVCPTLSGYLIAFDTNSRSLKWAFRYSTGSSETRQNNFGFRQPVEFRPMEPRSMENSVTIGGGVVIHMPPDESGKVCYALDLATGEQLWKLTRERYRYVAGIFGETVLLAKDGGLVARDLRTGAEVWPSFELGGTEVIAGRGVRNGMHYFLPTSKREIIEIDVATGSVVGRSQVERDLGNLVAAQGQIYSANATVLTAYAIRDEAAVDLQNELIDQDPVTPLVRQGELAMADGDLDRALDAIESAYQLEPENDDIRLLLMKAGIEALQKDFVKYSPRIQSFEELIRNGPRQMYLFGLINGFRKQGEYVDAFRSLMELSQDRLIRLARGEYGRANFEPETGLEIQEDHWIASQAELLWELADEGQRKAIGEIVADQIATLEKTVLPIQLRDSIHLKELPLMTPMQLNSVSRLIAIQEFALAEQTLARLRERLEDPERLEAEINQAVNRSDLSEQYQAALLDLNVKALRRSEVVRQVEASGRAMEEVDALLATREREFSSQGIFPGFAPMTTPELQNAYLPIADWPAATKEIEFPPVERKLSRFSGVACEIVHHEGDALKDWSFVMQLSELIIQNPWGREIMSVRFSGDQNVPDNPRVHVVNSLVFLETEYELFAIDTLSAGLGKRRVLWQERFGAAESNDLFQGRGRSRRSARQRETLWGTTEFDNPFQVITATYSSVIVHFADEIICFDALNGKRLWTRRGFHKKLHCGVDGTNLTVWEPALSRLSLLDIRNGVLNIQRSRPEIAEQKTLTTSGRFLITNAFPNRGDSEESVMTVWDLSDDEKILDRSFPSGTSAVIRDDRILFWLPNGTIVFWNLDERSESTWETGVTAAVNRMHLLPFNENWIVMPRSAAAEFLNPTVNLANHDAGGLYSKVSGPILAISPNDGKPLWDAPVQCREFYFAKSTLLRSPVLPLMRTLMFSTEKSGQAQEKTSFAFLDVRNGKLIHANDNYRSSRGFEFGMVIDPAEQWTAVGYGGQIAKIRFDDRGQPSTEVTGIGTVELEDLKESAFLEGSMVGQSIGPGLDSSLFDEDLQGLFGDG